MNGKDSLGVGRLSGSGFIEEEKDKRISVSGVKLPYTFRWDPLAAVQSPDDGLVCPSGSCGASALPR